MPAGLGPGKARDKSITIHLNKGSSNFSVTGQIVTILGFAGHMILMTRTQLCYRKVKMALDSADMNGAWLCPKKIVYKNRWLAGFGLWARL